MDLDEMFKQWKESIAGSVEAGNDNYHDGALGFLTFLKKENEKHQQWCPAYQSAPYDDCTCGGGAGEAGPSVAQLPWPERKTFPTDGSESDPSLRRRMLAAGKRRD